MKCHVFLEVIVPKPYIRHKNWRTKGISLGCQLAPEMISIAQNCAVWAVCWNQSPYQKYHFQRQFLGACKIPVQKFGNFSQVCALTHRFTSVVAWSKSVQDKCLKGRIVLVTEKKRNTFWHPLVPLADCCNAPMVYVHLIIDTLWITDMI